jgi:hypothetical protein
MIPESMAIIRGTVISSAPLKIQVINDDKLVLTENIICLPCHLSDYSTKCDIKLCDGTIDSQTQNNGEPLHIHKQDTFSIYNAEIKVYNALNVGEKVYILSFNHGKKYYILDRGV